MTLRRLEFLQWFGLFGAVGAWAGQHVVGSGLVVAECNPGGAHWGIENDVWQVALLISAGLVILAAQAAAVTVFRRTRYAGYKAPPPPGRIHFFATAAIVANVLFLMIVLLDGIASLAGTVCAQS